MCFNIIINISRTDTQNRLCVNRNINKTFVGGKSAECTYRNIPYGNFDKLWYLTATFIHNAPN